MGDLQVWCEIVCEDCGTTTEGKFYRKGRNGSSISQLRAEAKEAGWKCLDNRTLCPRCAEDCKASFKARMARMKEKKNGNQI